MADDTYTDGAKAKPLREMTDEERELIKRSNKQYGLSQSYWAEVRNLFSDDVAFANGSQWPEQIEREREHDNRPCLTINRMMQFIRQVTNDQRQNKPSIKVRPVDDFADKDTAEIMQGLIRHIEANSNADLAYDTATFYQVAGGFGFFRITTDYPDYGFEQEIYIKTIPNPLSVYWDHNSRLPDGSDWEYCFVTEEIPCDEFDDRYPDKPAPFMSDDISSWEREDTVRVAEYWYKEREEIDLYLLDSGQVVDQEVYDNMAEPRPEIINTRKQKVDKVKWCLRGGDRILDRGDWAGRYIPIVGVFGDWVDVNGKTYIKSLIRDGKDAQRMYNYYRSTETELMALQPKAPYIAAEGQTEGYEDMWEQANTAPFSTLVYKPTTIDGNLLAPPQRQAFATAPTGVMAGTQNSEADMMNTIGIQQAGLGMRSNETSGKAIMARQREGDTATYHFIDNLTRAIRYAGVILVDLMPRIYDTKRVVRILGEDGTEKVKQINAPTIEKDKYGQEIEKFYDLSAGAYDVVVSSGPNYTTKRQEAAESLTQILQGNPQLMQVAGDLLFKAFDFPMAEDIAERLKLTLPPELKPIEPDEDGAPPIPPEIQAQMEQMQQQIEQMGMALQEAQSQVDEKQSKLELDAAKLQIDQFKAETERMKAEADLRLRAQELQMASKDNDLTEEEKLNFEAELQIRLKEMDNEAAIARDLLKINASRQPQVQAPQPEMEEGDEDEGEEKGDDKTAMLACAVAEMAKAMTAPKRIIRDENGNPVGVERVGYDTAQTIVVDDGKIEGVE